MAQLIPVAVGLAFTGVSQIINRPKSQRNTIEGTKLDTEVPDSSFGYGLDYFYGRCKKNGCSLIWALPLREERLETTTSTGGKGGQRSSTTNVEFNYYLTAAYAIGHEIKSIEKVWASGELIYSKGDGTDRTSTFENNVEVFLGTDNQSISSVIDSNEPESIPSLRGVSYIVFDDFPLASYNGQGFPSIDIEVIGLESNKDEVHCFVGDVVKNICLLAGMQENEINVTELQVIENNDHLCHGFRLKSGQSYRSAIEDLQQMFFFIVQEDASIIYFLKQKRDIIKTIIFEKHLQANDGESSNFYKQKELNNEEIPNELTLNFTNVDNNFEDDAVLTYNPSSNHENASNLSTEVNLKAWKAREIVDRLIWEYEAQNITMENIFLLPSWLCLRVGDIFALIKESDTNYSQLWQVTKRVRGSNYLMQYEAVSFRGTVFSDDDFITISQVNTPSSPWIDTGNGETEDDLQGGIYTPDESAGNYGTSEIISIDTSLIADNDSEFIIYNAVNPTNEEWQNGALYYSINANDFNYYSSINSNSKIGTVSTALADHCSALPDTINFIRVVMNTPSMTISPVTESDFWQGRSLLYLGGEIIAYRDVNIVFNDPLTYDISYLIRGRRGTEYYSDQHTSNETLIILTDYLIEMIGSQNDINRTFNFKAVGNGQSEPAINTFNSILAAGNSVKPYPPIPVTAIKNGNNWDITWYRRTKRYGSLKDYSDIGFDNGEIDNYNLEILNGNSVVRTELINAIKSFIYTEAMQIADFGSVQITLAIRIRQLSSYPVALNNGRIYIF